MAKRLAVLRPRPRCRLRTQNLPATRACCFTSRAAAPNPRVFLDISIGDGEPQRITFEARPLHIWQAVSRAVTLPFVCCAALHTDCAAGCRPVPSLAPPTHTPLHFTYSPALVRVSVSASPNRVVLPPENFRALCTGARNVYSTDNAPSGTQLLRSGEKGTDTESGKPLHFKGSVFYRIIPEFMCQGGDITSNDGEGKPLLHRAVCSETRPESRAAGCRGSIDRRPIRWLRFPRRKRVQRRELPHQT